MTSDINKASSRQVTNRIDVKWVNLIPYLTLFLLIIVTGILQPKIFSLNWLGIKTDAVLTLALATIGQTLVLLIGGIDLSLGGVISLTNSLAATKMADNLPSMVGISIAILAMGAFLGAINGIIIVKLRTQPFIATLITWSIYGGIALWVLPTDGGNVPQRFISSLLARPAGIPVSLIIIAVIVALWLYLRRSPFVSSVIALGSNERSAYLLGININLVKIQVYALSGFFAASAGLYRTALVSSGSPTAGNGFILISVAAAVIGGTSLAGGKGSIVGSIIGAFILKLISDLLIFAGISSYWSALFQGLLLIIIIAAVSITELVKRQEEIKR